GRSVLMRIFISTGEASGDAYGAALVRHLRESISRPTFEGTGTARMREEGVNLLADSSSWGAVSIAQALRVYPRIRRVYGKICRALTHDPGLFIPVDFGYMNIRLARRAKANGWRVLYFVPPGSWRRDRQGTDLPKVTDAIVTPFSWSAEMLVEMGANAHWFGHPIRQLLAETGISLDQKRDAVAILPGSRRHEIEANLPVIAQAMADREVIAEFGLAPSVDRKWITEQWIRLSGRTGDKFTVGRAYDVLARAQAAIVCSGTATLEAVLCRCPMVVVYQLTQAMKFEAKLIRMKRPKYVALPNILLDRMAIPELVDTELTVAALKQQLDELLSNPRSQDAVFHEIEDILGPADAITRTAELAASILVD
ncbi:MAG TPA: hypothetical protein VK968_15715, partial [Roseimicrobium sp.]|nr:hypothetical protein [Roseimicrobium sp.]